METLRKGCAVAIVVAILALPRVAWPQSPSTLANLASDGRWTANTLEADIEAIGRSPCHAGELFAPDGLLHQPAFYYTLLGAGAALGGAFALDQTIRAHLHDMPSGVANGLQDSGGWFVAASALALYGYGLFGDEDRARQDALTGGESAMLAGLLTTGLKPVFGRRRPREGKGAFDFFAGGESMPSGHATPAFAGAAAISDYFDNQWYAVLPEYAAAFATGFGRIGNDAHWFSDIIGAGLVGVGTTELLGYLHRQHAEHPERFRIFPVVAPDATGLDVALTW